MNLHRTHSTDRLADDTLFASEKFKKLAERIRRIDYYESMLISNASCTVLIAIIAGSLATCWLGPTIPIVCVFGFVLVYWCLTRTVRAYVILQRPTIVRLRKLISETQDVAMLGPIVDIGSSLHLFRETYLGIHPTVDAAVLRLLPLITAAHTGLLNTRQRKCLHSYQFHGATGCACWQNLPYARGLIHALEQIGDKRDLPEIRTWLQLINDLNAFVVDPVEREERKELAAAIQRCLDTVAEREEVKDFLLRPDSRSESGADLLRPTSEAADTSPEQLLRSSSPDSAPPS